MSNVATVDRWEPRAPDATVAGLCRAYMDQWHSRGYGPDAGRDLVRVLADRLEELGDPLAAYLRWMVAERYTAFDASVPWIARLYTGEAKTGPGALNRWKRACPDG